MRVLNAPVRAPAMPTISVCLPCFDYGSTMEEAVDSVLSQDLPDLELLIGDNASTDETPRIGEAYARRDARVRYTRRPENIGYARNVNELLAAASGEFVTILGCDDRYLSPRFLSSAVQSLRAHPACSFLHSAYVDVDETGEPYRTVRYHDSERVESGHRMLASVLALRGPWISSVVARTDLVHAMGGFDLTHEFAWDLGWFVNLADRGDVLYSPEPWVTHRHHARSLSGCVDESVKLGHYRRLLELLAPRFQDDPELAEVIAASPALVDEQSHGAAEIDEAAIQRGVRGRLGSHVAHCSADAVPVAIYGAGMHTRDLLEEHDLTGVELVAFVDRDPGYAGELLAGRPIVTPEEIPGTGARAVLVSSRRYESEILAGLRTAFPDLDVRGLYSD